jgi:transposase-like protein
MSSSEWGFLELSCLELSKTQEIMKTEIKKKYGLATHDKRFANEEDCRKVLMELRWEDGRPTCPDEKCGNKYLNYYISSRKIWKCSACKEQFSLTKGTIFESSKLPLRTWFKAIYYFTTSKRNISSYQLAKWIEVEQRTAWFLLHRLRAALDNNEIPMLSGIVEVDETYIAPDSVKDKRVQKAKQKHEKEQNEKYGYSAKRKTSIRKQLKSQPDAETKLKEFNDKQRELNKNGERVPFQPAIAVLGLHQRNGDVVLIHLGRQYFDTTKKIITPFLINHISEDAELVTDQSQFYSEVGKRFLRHRVVNHEVSYVTKDGTHTNGIENVWNHLKRMIFGTYFHMALWHYQRYLSEHEYRWNVRKKEMQEQFDCFLGLVSGKRMKYQELIIDSKLAS